MPVTVNQTKNRFLLLFRQKQQNQWGPRTRISLAAIISRDVSAKSAPLPRCGARSDERIALRTTELLKASLSTRLLHAASVLAQTGAAPVQNPLPEYIQLISLAGSPDNALIFFGPLVQFMGFTPPLPLKKG